MPNQLTIAALTLCLACGALGVPAEAQSVLERLEKQIRQGSTPPPAANPNAAPQPAPPAPRPPQSPSFDDSEPAYLGLAADDREVRGRGARIVEIHPGGPAEKAGLRPGDLIVSLAGIRVRELKDIADIMQTMTPGRTVVVELMRDDSRQIVPVKLDRRRPAPPMLGPEIIPPPQAESPAAPKELSDIATLQRRIEELERRVAELERKMMESGK